MNLNCRLKRRACKTWEDARASDCMNAMREKAPDLLAARIDAAIAKDLDAELASLALMHDWAVANGYVDVAQACWEPVLDAAKKRDAENPPSES